MPGMIVKPEHIRGARLYQVNYEEEYGDFIPSIIGLARALKVPRSTLTNLTSYPPAADAVGVQIDMKRELIDIMVEINDMQHHALLEGGLRGTMNSNIVKLALGKHGYSDKQDNTIANPDGTKLDTTWTVNIVDPKPRQPDA